MSDTNQLLASIQTGAPLAAERLLPQVYDELRRLAAHKLAKEPPGHALDATALVHEAYLRLVGKHDPGWDGRAHFFATAARRSPPNPPLDLSDAVVLDIPDELKHATSVQAFVRIKSGYLHMTL